MTEPTIKATASFLINLMNFSRQHVRNDLQAKVLTDSLGMDKVSILTTNSLSVFASDTDPGSIRARKRKQKPVPEPEADPEEEIVYITSAEEVMLYIERFMTELNNPFITAKDLIKITNSMLRHLKEEGRLTPENILGELKTTHRSNKYKDPLKTMDENLLDAQKEIKEAQDEFENIKEWEESDEDILKGTFPLTTTGPTNKDFASIPDSDRTRRPDKTKVLIDKPDITEI